MPSFEDIIEDSAAFPSCPNCSNPTRYGENCTYCNHVAFDDFCECKHCTNLRQQVEPGCKGK